MKNAAVLDVSEQTFQTDVLERSFTTPVVVDFWAAWCGPCRVLGPVLERLAGEANGEWILAKVDVDSNQQLAAAFGIQGIPAVRAFRNGKQVAEFVGALPEPQVREWLKQLGPSKAELLVQHAAAAEQRGDHTAAADAYRAALNEEPANAAARSGLARAELALRTSSDGDEAGWRARVEADPTDVDAARALADILLARGAPGQAFDVLLATIRATSDDVREQARLHLLSLLDTLAPDHPAALQARRDLASALF